MADKQNETPKEGTEVVSQDRIQRAVREDRPQDVPTGTPADGDENQPKMPTPPKP